MYSHILLPIELDGQADVGEAVSKARALLADDGRLTLLHVVQPMPAYVESYLPADLPNQSLESAKSKLADIADGVGVTDTAVIYGPVGRSIVDWAEENSADCMVMASHQPALSDLLLGSTAGWVVRHARCAVLVLR